MNEAINDSDACGDNLQLSVMSASSVLIMLCLSRSCPVNFGKQLSDTKISIYNVALDLQGLFLDSVWHEKCQRRQDFNFPPHPHTHTLFLYWVTAPGWSLPLGQCATRVSSDWLTSGCSYHGKCPLEANKYPSSHLSVSRQNFHAVLVENTQCYFVHTCEHVCEWRMHVHTHVWQVRYCIRETQGRDIFLRLQRK